jgi:hypothetical protein
MYEVQAKGRERASKHAAKNKAARAAVSNGRPLANSRIGNIVNVLIDAPETELPLWEAFAKERLSQREINPPGTLN